MRALLYSRTFLIGLALRLLLMPFFGSHYLRELFVPFLDSGVLHPLENPWGQLEPRYFPYGIVLYGILLIPRLLGYAIFDIQALGATPLGLSLIKMPMLGMDVALLLVLRRLVPERTNQLTLFYWLNPIAIYITYVHGQLDLAATAFCVGSIFLLINSRLLLSAIAMAAATLCKFHVVIAVPFLLVYLWNRQFAQQAKLELFKWFSVWAGLSLLGFIPLYSARHILYATTSSPEAMRIFAPHLDFGSGQVLYIGVLAIIGVIGRLCISTRISKMGFVFGSGVIFGTLILATDPGPGWYFWVLPFIALLYSSYVNIPRSLYWGLSALYLVYFAGVQDYGLISPGTATGVLFTVVQSFLAANLVTMWMVAVRGEAILQNRTSPLLVGLAGDSGAGKNHACTLLRDLFTPKHTAVLEGDDYHKWERLHERWNDYTHLNPKANYLAEMALHTARLTRGQSILHSRYDHDKGVFTSAQETQPARTTIIQGLHTFYLRSLRDRLDLKIFLAPHPLVRLAWKIKRDVNERGHSTESILASLAKRQGDSKIHIEPQMRVSDWIFEVVPTEPITREEILAGKSIQLSLQSIVWNDAPLTPLVAALDAIDGCQCTEESVPENIDRVAIRFSGDPTVAEIRAISDRLFTNLRHITRAHEEPIWHAGLDGVFQLLAVALLSDASRGGKS